jgi:hypothetical protein
MPPVLADTARRCAHDEMRHDHLRLPGVVRLPLRAADQLPYRGVRDGCERLADGGERRVGEPGEDNVVESDD